MISVTDLIACAALAVSIGTAWYSRRTTERFEKARLVLEVEVAAFRVIALSQEADAVAVRLTSLLDAVFGGSMGASSVRQEHLQKLARSSDTVRVWQEKARGVVEGEGRDRLRRERLEDLSRSLADLKNQAIQIDRLLGERTKLSEKLQGQLRERK